MNPALRPTTHLFTAMGVLLVLVATLSASVAREGDLAGTDYFVFPFLHHGHGASPSFFFPGSWALNFLAPAYLLSVILNAIRPGATVIAFGASPIFLYIWLPVTAIGEVAGDTLVPMFTSVMDWPFRPLATGICAIFALGVVAGHLCARGSAGEW